MKRSYCGRCEIMKFLKYFVLNLGYNYLHQMAKKSSRTQKVQFPLDPRGLNTSLLNIQQLTEVGAVEEGRKSYTYGIKSSRDLTFILTASGTELFCIKLHSYKQSLSLSLLRAFTW